MTVQEPNIETTLPDSGSLYKLINTSKVVCHVRKLVSVMFDTWTSTVDEITGLDGLRIQAHCLIEYTSHSFLSCDSVGFCYYTVVSDNNGMRL